MDTSSKGVPAKIYAAAKGIGATLQDINLLLGLAAAESNFVVDAVGDTDLPTGPRYGLFQKETDKGVLLPEQVESAFNLMVKHNKELQRLKDEPWSHLCGTGKRDKWRYIRAAWQSKRERLTRWLDFLRGKFNSAQFSIRAVAPFITKPEDMKKAQHAFMVGMPFVTPQQREDAWDVKLKVKSLIQFAGTEGANTAALERGQATFDSFMQRENWAPAVALEAKAIAGEGAPAADVWGKTETSWDDPDKREALKEMADYPKSMAGYMRWAWDQVAHGGKAFAKGAVETLLPIAGIALAGGLGYVAIKNVIKAATDSRDEEASS